MRPTIIQLALQLGIDSESNVKDTRIQRIAIVLLCRLRMKTTIELSTRCDLNHFVYLGIQNQLGDGIIRESVEDKRSRE